MELVHERRYQTRQRARSELFEFIELYYNRQCLHSWLGYLSPAEYEARMAAQSLSIAA